MRRDHPPPERRIVRPGSRVPHLGGKAVPTTSTVNSSSSTLLTTCARERCNSRSSALVKLSPPNVKINRYPHPASVPLPWLRVADRRRVNEIVRHREPDPAENPWVNGPPPPETITIVPYNPQWPQRFSVLAADIRAALGETVLEIEHVGSTAVEGLAAKDVVDIVLTVADPRQEDVYVPFLERLGYYLTIREPSFHEHRCLRLADPRVNLHVFGPDCPETIRLRMFRDWLRTHPEDRARYEDAKRAAIPGGGNVMDYNARKQRVIREIYDRLFRAAGMK
ncbi:GrpB family protein [Nocardia huaxiensis]|uniref:GrpB family protein n=1 Tax=Nocardia huaxiensis TaxID=2755382 RepID=UPI001E353918|nr:GrpB family protein [Nocardia huaxiensis]UFS98596.1 GrpB family protein [Nocardia huaxiensis]